MSPPAPGTLAVGPSAASCAVGGLWFLFIQSPPTAHDAADVIIERVNSSELVSAKKYLVIDGCDL